MAYGQEPGEIEPSGEGLTREQVQNLVGQMIDEARAYVDDELDPIRSKSQDYFLAKPFGNEEEGRSKVVMSTVRDTVLALMPDMMRVFFGSERAVEYENVGGEDAAQAEQATDYTRHIISKDNKGYRVIWDAVMDAFVSLTGIVKSWWEVQTRTVTREMTGLSEEDLDVLFADESVEVEITEVRSGPDGAPQYDAKVKRTVREGRERIESCPPEEVYWNRSAADENSLTIVGHTRFDMPLDELVAMGYDRDEILENVGAAPSHPNGGEGLSDARRIDEGANAELDESRDPETQPVRFDESYVRLCIDPKDGVQWFKICTVGDSHYMIGDPVPVSHHPFSFWVALPTPHTIVGQDISALTKDLQEIDSAVMRGILDSLSLSLYPRTEAVESKVNLQDLMNTEIGAVIRTEAPGMVREVRHTFVGVDGLQVLEKTSDIKENRTGVSKAADGLNADALQSSTKAAVAATISTGQARKEIIARTLAETGYSQLMRNILLDITENQDTPRVLRLRGKVVKVDPRAWDAEMDVTVNVALGTGMIEDRLNVLQGAIAKQEMIMDKLGPMNPVVSISQYVSTINRALEMAGYPRPGEQFFKNVTPEQEAQLAEAAKAAQQQPPDPLAAAMAQAELAKARAEIERGQATIEIEKQKLALREREVALADDRARDQQAADTVLKIKELTLKYAHAIDRTEIEAEIERERAQLDAKVKLEIARTQAEENTDDDTE